jgi:antirestriction protein
MADTSEMKVWVGCLGCYNDGKLIGKWMPALEANDVTKEALGLTPTIYDLHEELWVFDFAGFGNLLTGECSPMEAQRIAQVIEDLPDHIDVDAFKAYVSYSMSDLDSAAESFEDAYRGKYDSKADFAQELYEETRATPDDPTDQWPFTCIDWDRAARDLFLDGFAFEDGYVFDTYA